MRKVDDGEKRKKKEIMTFIVGTNVIASRTPERQPTGTPHARAKILLAMTATQHYLPLSMSSQNWLAYTYLLGYLHSYI